MVHFTNVAIIGVGLIGGSLAKVLKANGLAGEVLGAGRSREGIETALKLGVIDRIEQDVVRAVVNADLVVLATPVGSFEGIVKEVCPALKPGAIVTDVGSVKGDLVRAIEKALPAGVHYVPGHPIAGKEKSGVSAATESLFRGATCIITPTPQTNPQALEAVKALWRTAGSTVITMDPDMHDKIFGAVSHLPHVAAYAMVNTVADLNTGSEDYITFSGAGFRDFTRIAESSPEMWTDICLLNRENIIQMIEKYQFTLNRLKKLLLAKDVARIRQSFTNASEVRKGLG